MKSLDETRERRVIFGVEAIHDDVLHIGHVQLDHRGLNIQIHRDGMCIGGENELARNQVADESDKRAKGSVGVGKDNQSDAGLFVVKKRSEMRVREKKKKKARKTART